MQDSKSLVVGLREFAIQFGKSNIRQNTLPLLDQNNKKEFISFLNAIDKANLSDPVGTKQIAEKSHNVLIKVLNAFDVINDSKEYKASEPVNSDNIEKQKIKSAIESVITSSGFSINS